MYQKVTTDMSFVAREEEVLQLWREKDVLKKRQARAKERGAEPYTAYDGPPTANGKPHIGHILTRAIKDVYPRYKAMKGYDVQFKAGWDTHGLPVELEVEKLLGIDGKPQIEAYGIEPFIRQCKQSVWKYKDEWEKMSERVAYSADMESPYVTYENPYIESIWWSLKQFWDKGLLYKGYKIVPYCPRCGTALSSHEVAQGYKDVKETSIFVRFKSKTEEKTYFAAWTTTPWTLPSNVALCVNPFEDYVLIEVKDNGHRGLACSHAEGHAEATGEAIRYYVVERQAEHLFGADYKLIKRLRGQEMEGLEYEPLFPFANSIVEQSGEKAWFVTADTYVTTEDGTGIVHIAPAFGEDDARIGRQYSLPFVQLVQDDGCLTPECAEFAGVFCKEADAGIIKRLDEEGTLLLAIPYEHNYPFCWRCDTPLLYYARHSWFIEMTKLRDRLVANNQTVTWIPEAIGTGRFGKFLEGVVDWSLSRERYWGTPLPVWICDDCGHKHLVGSIEELKSMSPDCPDEIELHRPYIDQVHLTCPCCQKQMTRVSEVIDCWYDSGAMPFAQFHYPFENKDYFEEHFPAQFISEALDQTRGWFYSLMAISTGIFDRSPYENCEVLGLVQDKHGQKMSKHKGNVVDPWDVLNKQGADAVRWYFYTNSNPWLPSRFSPEAVSEGQRKFISTFWNTYAFYVMYAEIDGFNPFEHQLVTERLNLMDRWILSKLQGLIQRVEQRLEAYDVTAAGRALEEFVDDLSNWYVRRNRERYWAGEMTDDKVDAYMTLFTVLENLCRLAAPFVPFVTEMVYQNIVCAVSSESEESVHLCSFPVADLSLVDEELEANMRGLLQVVVLGRAARNNSNMKNRQPLSTLYVSGLELPEGFQALALDELNIKTYQTMSDASELEDYAFKPQLRTLGRRFGKDLALVGEALKQLDGRSAMRQLQETGAIEIQLGERTERLAEEDLIVERKQAEGLASESDKGVTVALDLRLTDALISEGLLRELVSKVQTMRKEAKFEVLDRIVVAYEADETLQAVLAQQGQLLASEVLAESVVVLTPEVEATAESVKAWSINGHQCKLALRRVTK